MLGKIPIIGNKKRIFFISSMFGGCTYYRLFLPKKFIKSFDCEIDSDLKERKRIDSPFVKEKLLNSNIYVFHRPRDLSRWTIAYEMFQRGKKIVIDNDDTGHIDPDNPFVKLHRGGYKGMINMIKNAHLVTVTTEFLAKEYRKWNDNVIVLPNCLDLEVYSNLTGFRQNKLVRHQETKEFDKVRIGISGSSTYYENIKNFKWILKKLSKDKNIQLVIHGLADKETLVKKPEVKKFLQKTYEIYDNLDVEIINSCNIIDYPQSLNDANLDIMLIPRKDNYFNRCKSNLKYLEASALKIPVIAQGFKDGNSPYQKDIKNNENGFICCKDKEWWNTIQHLIENPAERQRLADTAYQYVRANYDIRKNIYKWEEAYENSFN